MNNLIMAWRNLWRNRRRTLITSASVFFAVLFALFFRSLQLGSYDKMFRNAIESYSGYIQVQHQDFWDEKTVDNTFPFDPVMVQQIEADENVITTIPRFESFALASSGPQTKGVLVMGIEPEKENYLSKVSDRMVKYRMTPEAVEQIQGNATIPEKTRDLSGVFEGYAYTSASRMQLDLGIRDEDAAEIMPSIERYTAFQNGNIRMDEPGAWVGYKLTQYLDLGIGDTIVLISQGYHATTAAGKYEIKGIVKMPLPDIDSRIVYLPLNTCQDLFNADGNLTSLVLQIDENDDRRIEATVERISRLVPQGQRVIDWKEMNEVLISQIEADDKSGMIMIGILYLVIAFGVFGTVLMMTAERRREFGVLVAIGMQKKKLAVIMSLEMLYIGLLGILAGSVVALGMIFYGLGHPIIFKGELAKMMEEYGMEAMMVFQGPDTYFLWQILIVALMVLIAVGYPLRKIFGLQVVTALRA